jgi:hypothetical protein
VQQRLQQQHHWRHQQHPAQVLQQLQQQLGWWQAKLLSPSGSGWWVWMIQSNCKPFGCWQC